MNLPSLIYILNEDHPIPARDVETGPGAEKLQALKELRKKRHTVSLFTTPEDLQAQIMHDFPTKLSQMGVKIEADALEKAEGSSDRDVLQTFQILPKLYAGRKVTMEFILANFRLAFDEDCAALRLERGTTVTAPTRIDASTLLNVHGERDIAPALTAMAPGSRVKAVANTAFGTYTQIIWNEEGASPFPRLCGEKGLVMT